MMIAKKKTSFNPRILVITPEVTALPAKMGIWAKYLHAKAGGLADVTASLINSLFDQGGDVHVAIPDYRSIFNKQFLSKNKIQFNADRACKYKKRIHLASDPAFFNLDQIYSSYEPKNKKLALIFQREVINTIIPQVQPDLIHCHDWMTGLIPPFARKQKIPCLFTIHNIHTARNSLSCIKNTGIDTAPFQNFFSYIPMHTKRKKNLFVDLLASGVSGAHCINTVSPTFIKEIIQGCHDRLNPVIRTGIEKKNKEGRAMAILNTPDSTYKPSKDANIHITYSADQHVNGKKANKRFLQKKLGLIQTDSAPLFFWPSRLDNTQKGCSLLAEILHDILQYYQGQKMQIVFISDGAFRMHFLDIIHRFGLYNSVAICDFSEGLSRQAFAASDFILMPSKFEPCGLPQMIGPIYGALPIVHDTGGLHDTVKPLNVNQNTGNGFLFKHYTAQHFAQSIHDAMAFYNLPEKLKTTQISRIMKQSASDFNYNTTAKKYFDLYERVLSFKSPSPPDSGCV